MKALICREKKKPPHMSLLWSAHIFMYICFWCDVFQMQPDGRHKNSLLGKYSIFIFTLYSQYIICNSQHCMVSVGTHSVFHTSIWSSIEWPPTCFPCPCPTSSSVPCPLVSTLPQHSGSVTQGLMKKRLMLPSHERTDNCYQRVHHWPGKNRHFRGIQLSFSK